MKKLFKVLSLVLLAVLAFTLTACAPKDGASAKERLLEEDYNVTVVESTDEESDVVCTVTAAKNIINSLLGEKDADGLIATLYKTNDAAQAAYDDLVDGKDKEEQKYDNYAKVGKWVIIGTEQAIKDFK